MNLSKRNTHKGHFSTPSNVAETTNFTRCLKDFEQDSKT